MLQRLCYEIERMTSQTNWQGTKRLVDEVTVNPALREQGLIP